MTKIRSITKYYKISWNDFPPHQQSSHEAELLLLFRHVLNVLIMIILFCDCAVGEDAVKPVTPSGVCNSNSATPPTTTPGGGQANEHTKCPAIPNNAVSAKTGLLLKEVDL